MMDLLKNLVLKSKVVYIMLLSLSVCVECSVKQSVTPKTLIQWKIPLFCIYFMYFFFSLWMNSKSDPNGEKKKTFLYVLYLEVYYVIVYMLKHTQITFTFSSISQWVQQKKNRLLCSFIGNITHELHENRPDFYFSAMFDYTSCVLCLVDCTQKICNEKNKRFLFLSIVVFFLLFAYFCSAKFLIMQSE